MGQPLWDPVHPFVSTPHNCPAPAACRALLCVLRKCGGQHRGLGAQGGREGQGGTCCNEGSSCEWTKEVTGQQTGQELTEHAGRGQRGATLLGHSDVQPPGGPWFASEQDELRALTSITLPLL